jgi:hypothetical protein
LPSFRLLAAPHSVTKNRLVAGILFCCDFL